MPHTTRVASSRSTTNQPVYSNAEYAGTIFAFANSIGNTAGFFVPLLAGVFVENAYDRVHWTPFWLATAAIMGCSGLIFLIFGQTRRQDFSLDEPDAAGSEAQVELSDLELWSSLEKKTRRNHLITRNNNNNNKTTALM